jgi:hypothetical protein
MTDEKVTKLSQRQILFDPECPQVATLASPLRKAADRKDTAEAVNCNDELTAH